MAETFDLADLKRRMQGALATLKHEFGGLRTGRASTSLLDPVHVDAYGQISPLNQVATLLGHSSLITTRLYTTPSEADLERAVGLVGD